MATPRKIKSGLWQIQGKWTLNGQTIRKSFTAEKKSDVITKYMEYALQIERRSTSNLTVREAILEYIASKENTLSPATVREYRRYEKSHAFYSLENVKIYELTTAMIQKWVSEYGQTRAMKSTINAYHFLIAAIRLQNPNAIYKVSFRKTLPRRLCCPTDDEIMLLYNAASGYLKICIALAAFVGGLRRGEISALTYADIVGNNLYVTKDCVKNENGKWVIKDIPKTSDSVRVIPIPSYVLKLIGNGDPNQKIIPWVPHTITVNFVKLRNSLGLQNIRFHDLRSYFASSSALIMPDFYTAKLGGWSKSSGTMKKVYQRIQEDQEKIFYDKLMEHFNALLHSEGE